MQFTRRSFLKAAAAAAVSIESAAVQTAAGPTEALPRRTLGKTNASVTLLGLGGAWIAYDKTARDHKASQARTRSIIEAAFDGGIRYFDTAPNYFLSEERLGPVLAPVRDQIFLVTKLDHADANTAEQDLLASLKLLKTDHVDLLLLHGLGLETFQDLKALQRKDGALAYLQQARAKGLTRFIGFSSHPVNMSGQRAFALETGVDVIQPFVNYVSRAENKVETILVDFARQHKIGVTAMKVLGGDGQLADEYDRAFRYTLSVPGVHCALIGAGSVEEVQRAVKAAREFRPLTAAEMEETIGLGRRLFENKSKKAALLRRHASRDLGGLLAAQGPTPDAGPC
jgi:predicted aldo/keto reductase-like oxidoreductase